MPFSCLCPGLPLDTSTATPNNSPRIITYTATDTATGRQATATRQVYVVDMSVVAQVSHSCGLIHHNKWMQQLALDMQCTPAVLQCLLWTATLPGCTILLAAWVLNSSPSPAFCYESC
jgi:hypothetical protein